MQRLREAREAAQKFTHAVSPGDLTKQAIDKAQHATRDAAVSASVKAQDLTNAAINGAGDLTTAALHGTKGLAKELAGDTVDLVKKARDEAGDVVNETIAIANKAVADTKELSSTIVTKAEDVVHDSGLDKLVRASPRDRTATGGSISEAALLELPMPRLRKRAEESEGVSMDEIGAALESEDPRGALIKLVHRGYASAAQEHCLEAEEGPSEARVAYEAYLALKFEGTRESAPREDAIALAASNEDRDTLMEYKEFLLMKEGIAPSSSLPKLPQYRVVHTAILRRGFEMDSHKHTEVCPCTSLAYMNVCIGHENTELRDLSATQHR